VSSLREAPSYTLSHLSGSAASYLVEGSGAHASPPCFLWAPLLWDGLFVIPVAGGLCPLAWLEGAGCHPSHTICGLRPLTTFCWLWLCHGSSLPSSAGGSHPSLLRSRGGYPPSLGGGLWQFNTFRQLPHPLWWVLVGGPFQGQSGDRHGNFRGLLARTCIHHLKGRRCLGRGCRPYVCGCPPEGGFEDLVCSNGQCIA
jgi:hypothetical protein